MAFTAIGIRRFIAGSITSWTACMTTELNALANAATATSTSAITNGGADQYADFWFTAGGSITAVAPASIALLILPSGPSAAYPQATPSMIVSSLSVNAGASTVTCYFRGILMPSTLSTTPVPFKVAITNNCGVGFSATLNTLSYFTYNETFANS